jgi:KDO2-lipid IV(A) lauroyltransferase
MLAFFVKLMCYLVRLIPVRLVGAMGAGIGRTVYFLNKRHRNIALRNLKRIFPDKNNAWHKATALASFAELGRTTFESPHVFLRSKEFLLSRIEFDGENEVRQAIDADHGVIFVGFHYSNWELAAQTAALLGCPSSQIYRPLRQQSLEELLSHWRERFGNTLHSRDESIRWIPRDLKQGKLLALLVDQHLSNGVPVPFLGHQARSTIMPAVYARKYNTPVYSGILHRIGRDFRFRIEFRRINFPEVTDNAEQDLCDFTEATYANFAAAIQQRPELWLWIHRRWLYLDEKEAEGAQNA